MSDRCVICGTRNRRAIDDASHCNDWFAARTCDRWQCQKEDRLEWERHTCAVLERIEDCRRDEVRRLMDHLPREFEHMIEEMM